jgi:hypothetical protein
MHILDDILWVLGVCNMSLSMLCVFWNIQNMEGCECKMWPDFLKKLWMEQRADCEEKSPH